VGAVDGILVDTAKNLHGFLDDDLRLLMDGAEGELSQQQESNLPIKLVSVKSGTVIADLQKELSRRGMALLQIGGGMAQTIGGAISTATHGSGSCIGSLADLIEAVVIVGSEGKVWQIESSRGVSDRRRFEARYRRSERELVQDSGWLNAVRVGMGCLGVIYSVIMQVSAEEYFLEESRKVSVCNQFDLFEVMFTNVKFAFLVQHTKMIMEPIFESGLLSLLFSAFCFFFFSDNCQIVA
jgi:FAD/FMN-containing dehydrogenase